MSIVTFMKLGVSGIVNLSISLRAKLYMRMLFAMSVLTFIV
jgi:hypothetical protein